MFPALVIVPSLQIGWTLFSILSGMLYFQEYVGMRPLPTALFIIGVAVRACAVHVCTPCLAKAGASSDPNRLLLRLCAQVVFGGVFLLTRASQPGPSSSGLSRAASANSPLAAKAARAGDGAFDQPAASGGGAGPPASDDASWALQAVRPASQQPATGAAGDGSLLGLCMAAQLSAQQQQARTHSGWQDFDHDEEGSDEEADYERALLSATSFTSSFRLQRQHTMQASSQQQQQRGQAKGRLHRTASAACDSAGAEAAEGLVTAPSAPEALAASAKRTR